MSAPKELSLSTALMYLRRAADDFANARDASEDGRTSDAALYINRAESALLSGERNARSVLARWQEYDLVLSSGSASARPLPGECVGGGSAAPANAESQQEQGGK